MFSLRWKILAWFFVNLLVIAGVIFAFLRVEFHMGIDSLLAGQTSERLEGIARPLATELRTLPTAQWNDALARAVSHWHARGLRAGLYHTDGAYVAGDAPALPKEVVDVIGQHDTRRFGPPDGGHGPPPHRGPPGSRGGDSPRMNAQGPPDDAIPGMMPDFMFDEPDHGPESFGDRGGGTESRRRGPRPPREQLPNAPLDKFMLATDSPRLYWVGVQLGEVQRPEHGGPPPGVALVLVSESLRGGGLFFDYLPWLLLGGGLALVSVLMWLPFVGSLTRSLSRMTHNAEQIAEGHFDVAQGNASRDELGRLGRALAHMAHRLGGFVTGQKRFLGDTAHELLSPIARLEIALSILDNKAGLNGEKKYIEAALLEVRHLSDIVQDLLSFTKAGMRDKGAALEPVSLAELALKAVKREAAEEWVVIAVDESLRVCAEPDLLVRALANAVRNAVRYAGKDGPITIAATPATDADGDEVVQLTVADQGPGVPPEALDQLFDPFFRPEDARTRDTGGNGLGLAIVKSCVEACHGRVAVRNRAPSGLELTFTLPRA